MKRRINVKKATVYAIIVLFIGISFLPNITANNNKFSDEEFFITITKPENAIYRNNQKIIPFFVPLILRGSIDIEIEISPPNIQLDQIEIYINNELVKTIGGPGPFENYLYTYEGNAFSKTTIKIIGYGLGDIGQKSSMVTFWKIFP